MTGTIRRVTFSSLPSEFAEKATELPSKQIQLNNGFTCPKCGKLHCRVVDSRGAIVGEKLTVRRARKCTSCGEKWHTLEIMEAEMERLLGVDPPSRQDAIWQLALELTALLKAERGGK